MLKKTFFALFYVFCGGMFVKSFLDFSTMAWNLHIQFEHDIFGVLMLLFCFAAYALVAVIAIYLFLKRNKD